MSIDNFISIMFLLENDLKTNTNLVKENNYVTFASRPKYTVLDNK